VERDNSLQGAVLADFASTGASVVLPRVRLRLKGD
jgi:hypothetical protein